jgi:hypothetical protein
MCHSCPSCGEADLGLCQRATGLGELRIFVSQLSHRTAGTAVPQCATAVPAVEELILGLCQRSYGTW